MRCDGRTFTETNGNIVSEKADRAVNQGPNTEKINISKNSSEFSDHLCARQQMHQALSGHFSPQMSHKTGWFEGAPLAGRRPWTLTTELDQLLRSCCLVSCGQTSFQSFYHPSWDLFQDSSSELSSLMMPLCLASWKHKGERLPSVNAVLFFFIFKGLLPASLLTRSQFMDSGWLCKVNSSNTWQVMYSCHIKASVSDLLTVHHRAPVWTGLSQMPVVDYKETRPTCIAATWLSCVRPH